MWILYLKNGVGVSDLVEPSIFYIFCYICCWTIEELYASILLNSLCVYIIYFGEMFKINKTLFCLVSNKNKPQIWHFYFFVEVTLKTENKSQLVLIGDLIFFDNTCEFSKFGSSQRPEVLLALFIARWPVIYMWCMLITYLIID